MQPEQPRFSLAELVDASGVNERMIRTFITEGLVPPALGRGRARYFTPDHLARLELVAKLRADRLSIDEVRERLHTSTSTNSLNAATWNRITLHPDLELHFSADAPESVRALARELAQQAARWFGDE